MKMQVKLFDSKGKALDDVTLNTEIFGAEPNAHVMHLHLVRQLANWRAGTASTLTRSEVSGGGKKPWKQKGTGRARAGSNRSPLWKGGGVIFGPKPRSYRKDMPRKERRLALRSALATKQDDLVVIQSWDITEPKTKAVVNLLQQMGLNGKTLLVVEAPHQALAKSVRNLPEARLILAENLNVKDLLYYDKVLVTQAALTRIEEIFAR